MTNFFLTALIIAGYCSQIAFAGQLNPASSMPLVSVDNVLTAPDEIELICDYISSGDFAKGEMSLRSCRNISVDSVRQLTKIIDDHKRFISKREATRNNYFSKYNDDLKSFRKLNLSDSHEKLVDVFEVAVKTYGVANEYQKQSIRDDLFLKQVIDISLSRAFYMESQGNWLGAYTDCYRHLQKIFPDNMEYAQHSQILLEKNEILASLSDSPCEKFSDRYSGIDMATFEKAIDMLHGNYVVRMIDYRTMALSAIKRCNLLTDVVSTYKPGNDSVFAIDKSITGNLRAGKKLSNWKAALDLTCEHLRSDTDPVSKEKFLDIFRKTLAANSNTIKLPPEVLILHFSRGAFAGIDRHTNVIWPQEVDDFTKNVSGKFSGVGVTFSMNDGRWVITGLLLDTPAYRSSLRIGDVIHAVDGVETANMTAACIVKYITGMSKSTVTLTIKTDGKSEKRNVKLKRASISVPSVRGWQRTGSSQWLYMIDMDNRIGYIRIALFTENTADEFAAALAKLESKGLKGLILDLRSNPGGQVDTAAKVVDYFIEKGMIVSIRPRFGMPNYISAKNNSRKRNYPLVILINNRSASAAEIVAGALQDKKHNRAVLVGERTFGKGSVQNVKDLTGKSKMKLTVAYYHLPSGQKVEIAGSADFSGKYSGAITPDVEVVLTPEEQRTIADVITSNETLTAYGKAISRNKSQRYSNIETISLDPQLFIANQVLKAKIIGHKLSVE